MDLRKKVSKNRIILMISVIIILGFISYINVYDNSFVWDDEFLIQKNIFIQDFQYLPEIFSSSSTAGAGGIDNFYRPLQLVMYSLVYQFFGMSLFGFHFLNVLIHVSSGVLLFILIRKIFKIDLLAFLTSLLWVIHPVHTEAITYISGTADPLSVLFALGSFIFYINFRESEKSKCLVFSGVFFVLAILSKETMIILPLLFILYEFISDKNNLKGFKKAIPFFAISFGYFISRITFLNFGNTLNLYESSNIYTEFLFVRIFTFLASLLEYYSLLLWPTNLHMERSFPVFVSFFSPKVFISFLIFVGLAFLAYYSLKRKKHIIFFGICWFFISFLPMSGILVPVNSFLLEHWLYFSSIGFFIIFSYFVHRLLKVKKQRLLAVIIIVLLVSCLVVTTINQNKNWENPIIFYNNILKYEEGTPRVYNNLAMAYSDRGKRDLAKKYYKKSIKQSSNYPQPHYNLARVYIEQKKYSEAIYHLEKSININPNFFYSYYLLGEVYEEQNKTQLAKKYYKKANNTKYS